MRRVDNRHSERGFAIFVVAGWLTLSLFVGMAVDIGILMRYRRAMQNSCDSGALAGALYMRAAPNLVASTATRYASADMTQNNIAWNSLTATTMDNNNQPTGTNPTRVKVDISDAVPTFFFKLVTPSVNVGSECIAAVVPVIRTAGLSPVGLWNSEFQNFWLNTLNQQPCLPNDTRSACATDFPMTVNTNQQSSGCGSGGTCRLNLTAAPGCSQNGAQGWACTFQQGSGGTYCFASTTNPPVPSCAIAQVATGVAIGGGLDTALFGDHQNPNGRCTTPAPPNPQSKWIVTVPLVDDSNNASDPYSVHNLTGNSGPTLIMGFAAFQLDCTYMQTHRPTGNNAVIYGKFVYLLETQGVGGDTSQDTGLETIRLIQ